MFNCDAARQAEWLEHLQTLNQVQRGLPGLISAPLHRGANGRTVGNYVVRAAAEGWKAVTRHPDVVEDMRPIMAFATFEPHLQEPGEVIS